MWAFFERLIVLAIENASSWWLFCLCSADVVITIVNTVQQPLVTCSLRSPYPFLFTACSIATAFRPSVCLSIRRLHWGIVVRQVEIVWQQFHSLSADLNITSLLPREQILAWIGGGYERYSGFRHTYLWKRRYFKFVLCDVFSACTNVNGLIVLICYSLTHWMSVVVALLSVMQTTWRERNQQTRIKSAKDALEKNPEWVCHKIHT